MAVPRSVQERLFDREQAGNLRHLPKSSSAIDFSSNDYLGFSRTGLLRERTATVLETLDRKQLGATGSRLISGNSSFLEELENDIASFHGGEASLIFNSGYDANVGVLQTIPTRHDSIIYDERSHASIIDGAKGACVKNAWSFQHNDLDDLRSKLKQAKGDRFVVVESVYSMDGDFSPLIELSSLCEAEGAFLVVDEAHATGIYGEKGQGKVFELGLEDKVLCRIHTFGKALGTQGAAVVSSSAVKNLLINFSRPFIYTTALPLPTQASIKASYEMLQSSGASPVNLFMLIHEFRQTAKKLFPDMMLDSYSPIQGIIISSNSRCKRVAEAITLKGFDVKAILSPTVKEGFERLRISLHTFNASPEVQALLHGILEAM